MFPAATALVNPLGMLLKIAPSGVAERLAAFVGDEAAEAAEEVAEEAAEAADEAAEAAKEAAKDAKKAAE